jgi:hypothetical protein
MVGDLEESEALATYWVLMLPNGLNPSVAKASLKFLGSAAKSISLLSK